jgi:hypothetical protein
MGVVDAQLTAFLEVGLVAAQLKRERLMASSGKRDLTSRLSQDLPPVDHELHVPQNRWTHADVAHWYSKVPLLRILEFESMLVIDVGIGDEEGDLQGFY